MPKKKSLILPTSFKMPRRYKHVSLLFAGETLIGIIEAQPPRKIECACNARGDAVLESRLLDWSAQVLAIIRKDNGADE